MVANFIQDSLFSQFENFKNYDNLFKKQKKKRVHYQNPTFRKSYKNDITDTGFLKDDIASWGRMEKVYIELANFFPILFINDCQDFGLFRVWVDEYIKENYVHEKNDYKGQEFKYVSCEIIGSEGLLVEQRLELHLKVLNMLKNKCDMVDVEKYIKEYLGGLQKD